MDQYAGSELKLTKKVEQGQIKLNEYHRTLDAYERLKHNLMKALSHLQKEVQLLKK